MGKWAQVTYRVAKTRPDVHRMRIAPRGYFGAGPRYQHLTAFGCNSFPFFTLQKPGFRKGNGLLDGGEPHPHLMGGLKSEVGWSCRAI